MAETHRRGKYGRKVMHFLKYHLHIALYAYFGFGLFVCGLVAPPDRVAGLETHLISKGWHLSLMSLFLILPVPIGYLVRMRRGSSRAEEST
jgi:hypothetical protein